MKELEWLTGGYENSRLHYLYRGERNLGLVSRLGDSDNIRGYGVYLRMPDNSGTHVNEFKCIMPTLDEAKGLLQTIVGAQL